MGTSNGRADSDRLHREADAIGASQPHVSEVINPAKRLARQEAEAGLPQTDTRRMPAPAPAAPAPTMSQTDFGKGGSTPRTGPPADLLKRHQSK